jgi:hypothetical protein
MGIDSHLSTCVGTQSPKYLEMAQGHISLYPDVRSSRQSRSDRSHFAAPLTDLTIKQRRLPCSDCRATRQSEVDSG